MHAITAIGNPTIALDPTPLADASVAQSASKTIVGPLRAPQDGSILSDARALVASASHKLAPHPAASADALVTHVALLEQAGVPMISASVVHAVSSSRCTGPSHATVSGVGSSLAGVVIGSQIIDETPDPNTTIPLTLGDAAVTVILNEQRPAADGTGLVVTMIHVIGDVPELATFLDVRIAEAYSSVWCGPATAPSGPDNDIKIGKVATHTTSDLHGALDADHIATAHRGEFVTWRVTVHNASDHACVLHSVTDSLPAHFEFDSSSGPLGQGTANGLVATWSPAITLGAGKSLVQTVLARVANDAPLGTYTNEFTVFESTCSEFTSGLAGPVTIVPRTSTRVYARHYPSGKKLPATGVEDTQLAAMLLLAAAAAVARVMRTQ